MGKARRQMKSICRGGGCWIPEGFRRRSRCKLCDLPIRSGGRCGNCYNRLKSNRFDELMRSARASVIQGFLPDLSHAIYEVYLDGPMRNYTTARDFMVDLANVCVKKFNETKGKTLELVNVLRATERGEAKRKLYITFMAREYENGPLVEYQAKVVQFPGDVQPPFPILCRPSPKPET